MRSYQKRDRIILDSLVKDGQEYLYAVVDTNSGTLYFHGSEIGKKYLRNKLDFLNQFWSICMSISKGHRKIESGQGDLHKTTVSMPDELEIDEGQNTGKQFTSIKPCKIFNSDGIQNVQTINVDNSQIPVRGRPRKKRPIKQNKTQQIPQKIPKLNNILYLDDAEKPHDSMETVLATQEPVSTLDAIATSSAMDTGVTPIPAVSSGGNNSSMITSNSDIIKHITSSYAVREENPDWTFPQNDSTVYMYPSLVSLASDSTTADISVNVVSDRSETSSEKLDKLNMLNFQSNINQYIQVMFTGDDSLQATEIVNGLGEQTGKNSDVAIASDFSTQIENDKCGPGPLVSSTCGDEMYEAQQDNSNSNGEHHSIKILPLIKSVKVEENSPHRNNGRAFSVFAEVDKDKSITQTDIQSEQVDNEQSEQVNEACTTELTDTGSEQINKNGAIKDTDNEHADNNGTDKIADPGNEQVGNHGTVELISSLHKNIESAIEQDNSKNELLNDAESEQLSNDGTVKLTDTQNEQGDVDSCDKFPDEGSSELKCEEPWEYEDKEKQILEMMSDEDYNYESESNSDEYAIPSKSSKLCKKKKSEECKNKAPLDLHCKICNKTFKRPKRFEVHVLNHSKTNFECKKCGKSFKSLQTLNGHNHVKHSGMSFQCEFCGKCYEDKRQLKLHIKKIHDGITPYECQICHEKFRWNNTYKSHYLRHSDEPPPTYLCCICGKNYTTQDILNRHLKIHTEDKKHKCEHCNRTFVQSYALKRHLRSHTGEKPYKCTTCNLTFAHNVSLKNHIRKAHK